MKRVLLLTIPRGKTYIQSDGNVIFVDNFGKETIRYTELRDGYVRVRLRCSGKSYWFTVHKLVAIYFIGKPVGDRNQINHIDGNKLNNNDWNLEWCTVEENNEHSTKILGNTGINKKFLKNCELYM